MVSIGVYKCATSLTIVSVILALGEYSQEVIKRPLWEFVADNSYDYDLRIMAWVGVWVVTYTIMIVTLHKLHIWLNVTKSKEARVVQWILTGSLILQILKYLDEILISSKAMLMLYQFGIPIINLSLAVYVLYVLLRKILDVNFKVSVRPAGH